MTNRINPWVFVINLSFSLLIWAYVFFLMPVSILSRLVMGFTLVSAIAQVWFFRSGSVNNRKRYFYIVMLHVFYLFAEVVVYMLFTVHVVRADAQFLDNRFEANTNAWARYDSVIGYKGIPGSFRNVKYSNGVSEYDHTSHINNQGWFSANDYVPQKRAGIKRYAVLGDSFSAGFNVANTWPDLASDRMDSIELYNFALEGIGINNWYLIFFNEITRYEFDGLIIATSNELFGISDLDRKLMIMHSTMEATFIGQYDSLPAPDDFYSQLPQMTKGYTLIPDNEMDEVICNYQPNCNEKIALPPLDLYFLHTTISIFKQLGTYFKMEQDFEAHKLEVAERFPDNRQMMNLEDLKQKYPYIDLLQSIITHCQQTGKEVILAGIPDVSGVRDSALANRTQSEMQLLAQLFNIHYFNGFSCFNAMTQKEAEAYYYQYDLHWNQKGASLFADRFSYWLKNENPL